MKPDKIMNVKRISNTRFVVTVGIFSAIAFILQMLGSFIGLKVGGFLEVEFSDLPALILSLAYGPLTGVFVELIKNILHLFITSTGGVGELANFVVNGTLCLVCGLIYRYKKGIKGAVISLAAAVILMTVIGIFSNLFIMLPLYMSGVPFINRFELVMSLIVPFNLARGTILSILTFLLYKRISRVIK